jgi:hypothetical protein
MDSMKWHLVPYTIIFAPSCVDEKIIAVKAYFLFPPPAFRSFSRNFLALSRHGLRPRRAALFAKRLCGRVLAVVRDSLFTLAGQYAHDMDGVADHVGPGRFSPLGPVGICMFFQEVV